MATDPVLQWRTHVTDSTDQDTILGNLDFLEQFGEAITGDTSLQEHFKEIRNGINNGTIKPTEWKDSTDFKKIISKLTNASSGKISTLTKQGEDFKTTLGKKLDSTDFSAFKEGDFKITTESLGTRLDTAEDSITDHTTTLSGYGTRIKNAEIALGKKLDSSKFENFKKYTNEQLGTLAPNSALEALRTLLNNEISHWTRATTPKPLDSYKALADLKKFEQPWEEGVNAEDKDYLPERHIGDLCTVIGEKATDKGVSYRFVKHDTNDSYTWTKVIDNDGALALNKYAEFIVEYDKRQTKIDNTLAEKQPKGNYIEKKEFDANNTKVDQEIKGLKGTYKVTVTTQGEIRNGQIIGGTTHDGKPAILHTAHVYGILGNKITNTEILNKLKWTVNSGRTSSPKQRFVTGATCYVTADDFVRVLHTQGSTPQFYDIELNSSF